jgi:hypothetical protein
MVSTARRSTWVRVYLGWAFFAIPTSFSELCAMQSCPDQVTFLFIGFNALKYRPNVDLET